MNRDQRRHAAKAFSPNTNALHNVPRKAAPSDDKPRYWLAICGAAVPCQESPLTVEQAQSMIVQVGMSPGEPTFWIQGDTGRELGMRSNYQFLFGFETRGAMHRAQATILEAPLPEAHAEVRRLIAANDVVCISGDSHETLSASRVLATASAVAEANPHTNKDDIIMTAETPPHTVTVTVQIPPPLLDAARGTPDKSNENYSIFLLGCELEDEVAYDDDDVVSVRRSDAESGESFSYELTLAEGVNPAAARTAALVAAEAHIQGYTHHVAYRLLVPHRRIPGTVSIVTPLDVAISEDVWRRIKARNAETGLRGEEREAALARSIVDALEAGFPKG